MSPEAKRSLAESLGMTRDSLQKWMRRKWQEERNLEEAKNQLQTPYKQEHRPDVADIMIILLVYSCNPNSINTKVPFSRDSHIHVCVTKFTLHA